MNNDDTFNLESELHIKKERKIGSGMFERQTNTDKLGFTETQYKALHIINKNISDNIEYQIQRHLILQGCKNKSRLFTKLDIKPNEYHVIRMIADTPPNRPATIPKLLYFGMKFGVNPEYFLCDPKQNNKEEEKEIIPDPVVRKIRLTEKEEIKTKIEDETALTRFNLTDELIIEDFKDISYDNIRQKVKHNSILLLEIAERRYIKEFKLKDLYSDNTNCFSLRSLNGVENETDIINKSWEDLEKITQIKLIGRVVKVIKYL
ncbi:MAG: hypothetical protein CMC98_02985 [Flavobacteriales bacterium]|nr:hypothetical protein [Flavobacteriales bacterium]|tara:strand:- start:78 stop:863 length:786 start_codon:yes stop_codon:yes gene_type:complete